MAQELTAVINRQINLKYLKTRYIFKVNSVDYSAYLKDKSISMNTDFGSVLASFTLFNSSGLFGRGGESQIYIGDVIEYIEYYRGDSTQWKRFYGEVNQINITKSNNERDIVLTCLDYIGKLKNWDIDLIVEADSVEATDETLSPNFLPSPNENTAQVFDFANENVAQNPLPIIKIEHNALDDSEIQYDGFEISYDTGQLKLGKSINAVDWSVTCSSYYYYPKGLYAEDILQSILCEPDGYNNYLFNEDSSTDLIANHLRSTFYAEEVKSVDTMTPNSSATSIVIETTLASNYDPEASGDTSFIIVNSTEGFPEPESGQTITAEINGDTFTYTAIGSGNTLQGIPLSGDNSLGFHSAGDYVRYTATYSAGQVWYCTFNNIITQLTASDFSVPSGIAINYVDLRYGRIILSKAIDSSSTVTCDTNYTFCTLQASGIEINKMNFRSREIENRFEAINKLKDYLAPNYIIRTQGDNKIWGSYLSQKNVADYTLNLEQKFNYLSDDSPYTRVKIFANNKNPTNVCYNTDAQFITTDEEYTAHAIDIELEYDRAEGDSYVYRVVGIDGGRINSYKSVPFVKINGIKIEEGSQELTLTDAWHYDWWTSPQSGGVIYYHYVLYCDRTPVDPSYPVTFYDATATPLITVPPNSSYFDYKHGAYPLGTNEQRDDVTSISTATYHVIYQSSDVQVDYENMEFHIRKGLISDVATDVVTGDFWYDAVMQEYEAIDKMIDGKFSTQVQTIWVAQPPTGFNYAILDLGDIYNIQAIDIMAGFFKPEGTSYKFDINFSFSLQYSLDNSNYYAVSNETTNVGLTGGESVSFEEQDLGIGFEARYLKIVLEDVSKIEYQTGYYVVAFSEIAVYTNIVLESEATLIRTTTLTQNINFGDTTVYVVSTEGFEEPSSGTTVTVYLDKDENKYFTYTGISGNTFVGCEVGSSIAELAGTTVTASIETDTTLYDDNNLLGTYGDRLKKIDRTQQNDLFLQNELDDLSKSWLREVVKDHDKIQVSILKQSFLKIGQTVHVTDSYNNIDDNYFIDSISERDYIYDLVLARYPS